MQSVSASVVTMNPWTKGRSLIMKGGHDMMHFSLFNLTFTVSIRKQRTNQERYEDHIRIDALRNQMLDKRYECRRYMY